MECGRVVTIPVIEIPAVRVAALKHIGEAPDVATVVDGGGGVVVLAVDAAGRHVVGVAADADERSRVAAQLVIGVRPVMVTRTVAVV